jgi:hypothetical protein
MKIPRRLRQPPEQRGAVDQTTGEDVNDLALALDDAVRL